MNDKLSVDSNSIDKKNEEIAQKILENDSLEETKDLTTLFNLNIQKRNVLRILKMNSLLDKLSDEMVERFENHPDLFTNEDLLKYMQVTEASIDKSKKDLNLVKDTPSIQLLQSNNVNININQELDRESRKKVADTVQEILKRINNNSVNEDIIDVDYKIEE